MLEQLKGGVPSFSPRYVGHMTSDLTLASLVGYFAALLYNPNNVSSDASPVTTRLEIEVADQLARMIGYRSEKHWGHLTSGGTVAKFEALWVARNLKYFPVAVAWACREAGVGELAVTLADGQRAPIRALDLWSLLNLSTSSALDAADDLVRRIGNRTRAERLLGAHTLAQADRKNNAGLQSGRDGTAGGRPRLREGRSGPGVRLARSWNRLGTNPCPGGWRRRGAAPEGAGGAEGCDGQWGGGR